MSNDRRTKEEERLQGEVDRLLREAEAADRKEDSVYGADKRGDELPEELAFREKRLAKIREAKAALEREAVESAMAKGDPQGENAKPEGKAQKNFTDPESRIMPFSSDKGSFVQAYNAQAVVDAANQVSVAEDVTQQANDKKQEVPMMGQAKANNGGEAPAKASLDAGYFSETNILEVEKLGTEAFIPPDRLKHGKKKSDCPQGRIPREASAAERMRRKLTTKRGGRIYAKRKKIVEPVFGQIKQGRGFRQFLLRGIAKVKGEWSLICTTHNLLKLWRNLGVANGGPPGRVDWAVG